MAVLQDQLSQLGAGVFHHGVVARRHGEHGDLGPGHKAGAIAQVVDLLRVLVVGKPYRVGPQILQDGEVFLHLRRGRGAALALTVVMACHAVEAQAFPIEGEAVFGVQRYAAKAKWQAHLITNRITAQKPGRAAVAIRIRLSVP